VTKGTVLDGFKSRYAQCVGADRQTVASSPVLSVGDFANESWRERIGFLAIANQELFVPHGLFAKVTTHAASQNEKPLPDLGPLNLCPPSSLRWEVQAPLKVNDFVAEYADRRIEEPQCGRRERGGDGWEGGLRENVSVRAFEVEMGVLTNSRIS